MKRISLFLMTNLAVTLGIGIIGFIALSALGIDPLSYVDVLLVSFVMGFAGSIISLLMSKSSAKNSVGAVAITTPKNEAEAWLVQTVTRMAEQRGIKMPEVAIYQADEMNAFATGAFRDSALVAVSTGLMQQMTRDEVEAVLAHEMSHVNNGDMVTMTLLQGLVNTFVIFIARVIASVISRSSSKDGGGGGSLVQYGIYGILQAGLMSVANIVIMWFSRHREYYADAGAAELVGAPKMIAALKRLGQPQRQIDAEETLPKGLQVFGIAINGERDSFMSTHPSLANRIAALEAGSYISK